jgi:hypothetical protein
MSSVFKPMKTRTLPAAAMLLTLTSFAQPGSGQLISSVPGERIMITSQAISADGYVYYSGAHQPVTGGPLLYIAKADTAGLIIWERYVDDVISVATEIAADQNSVYVACYENVLRFDTNGNLIWRKAVQEEGQVLVNDVLIDETGGCVIAGMYGLLPVPKKVSFLCKLDSTGIVIWDKEILWAGYNGSFFYSLVQDDAHNIYACGGAGVSYMPIDVGTVAKFTPQGSMLWSKTIVPDTNTSVCFYHSDFRKHEIVIAGAAISHLPGMPILFVRLDTMGNTLDAALIPVNSATNCSINSIHCTPFNTVMVTGQQSDGITTEGILMELDYNLNFTRGLLHPGTHELNGITMINTGNYVSGRRNESGGIAYRGYSDYSWNFGCGFQSFTVPVYAQTVVTGLLPDSISNVTISDTVATVHTLSTLSTTCTNPVGINDPLPGAFSLYPNAASDRVVLTFPEALSAPVNISVYDALGRTVYTMLCPAGSVSQNINTSTWSTGTYTVHAGSGSKPLIIAH